MCISNAIFMMAIFFSPTAVCAMQSPPAAAPKQDLPPAPVDPSGLLQPSLDTVQQTLGSLRLEKWKRGTVRDEADTNSSKIMRDLQETLPPLLRGADAAPATLSNLLPVSRNVDALYDVFLRVVEGARVSAPVDQVTQLEQTLISLANARHALDDRMQEAALAQEKQISDLRGKLQAQAAVKPVVAPAPAPVPCVPPVPRKAKRKPKPKPPATTPKKSTVPVPGTPKTGP